MNECVNIHNIRKRLRGLAYTESTFANQENLRKNVQIALESNNPKDIMKSIEYGCRIIPIQFESVLTLFDALYEYGTTGQLVKMKNYICEEAAPKVRDAKETNTNLKRKLARVKTSINTNINKTISNTQGAIANAINGAKTNFQSNTTQIANNVKSGLGLQSDDKQSEAKQEAYLKCYEDIIGALSICEHCDRILENYDTISRRFNLEKLFIENVNCNGIGDTVIELCHFIETYDMPDYVKYNTVIETAWYGFEQNGIEYNKSELLEAATDYFLMKENGYEFCKEILENTVIFDKQDMPAGMQVITELEPAEGKYNSVFDRLDEVSAQLSETAGMTLVKEQADFDKLFNDYKKSHESKDPNKLAALVRKLYSLNVSNIVDETPNFLKWIRYVFILGNFALHPILGAVVSIGSIFARLKYERDETQKMIKCFDKEIKASEDKMNSTKDPEDKKRLKAYIESLEKAREKIDQYYDNMLSDKELEKKYSDDPDDVEGDSFDDIKTDIKDGADEWDDIDDDDDFDWDKFDEAAVDTIVNTDALIDAKEKYSSIPVNTLTHMSIFNGEDLDSLAKLSVIYPDVWSPDLMESAIQGQLNKIRKNKIAFESAMDRFHKINDYENAISILHSYKAPEIHTIGESKVYLECLVGALESVAIIIDTWDNKNVMVEASFTNALKLASINLKKFMQKLSDKDKAISKTVDMNVNVFMKSVDNALSNENREQVIKGSVLPPASKIIKLAITTGALWLVQPALAVISALGYLGMSAKHRKKERALIIDELDTELKICNKYIERAEAKDDMKALKQLYNIQKSLTRQRQRLEYKMKVDFNQNVPKINTNSDRGY